MRKFLYGRYKTSNRADATPDLSWTTTILSPGAVGDKWTAELMEEKVEILVPAAPTPTIVADLLAAALDALPGITSTNSGAVITTTRTATPTLEIDVVSHLTIQVEGFGPDDAGPYPRPSGNDGVQYLNLNGASGGTFTLTVYSRFDQDGSSPEADDSDGHTTAPLAFGASAATVQAALDALPNVEPGDIVVTLPESGYYSLAFGGRWGLPRLNWVPLMSVDGALLTGGTPPTLVYSEGSFTNVVATQAAVSLGEFAVYRSVPSA